MKYLSCNVSKVRELINHNFSRMGRASGAGSRFIHGCNSCRRPRQQTIIPDLDCGSLFNATRMLAPIIMTIKAKHYSDESVR
jgi:hypothetical protein